MPDDSFDYSNDDFDYIDRCALIVRPTWKLVEWINSLSEDDHSSNAEAFSETVYLVDYKDGLDVTSVADLLKANYLDIAISEFSSWWTDPSDWPAIRSLEDFFQYFDYTPSETVIDLCGDKEEDEDEMDD